MLTLLIILLKLAFAICATILFALSLWALDKEGDRK